MTVKGLDIELSSLNTTGKIKWSTTLNFSYNEDKITKLFLSNKQGSAFVGGPGLLSLTRVEGNPVYGIYSYRWAGLDPANGDPMGYLNGQVSKNYTNLTGAATQLSDIVYNGRALPAVFGAIRNTLTYRAFSLSANITYKFNYYFKKESINYSQLFTTGTGHSDYEKRWQQPGDELKTDVISMPYPSNSARDAFYNGSEILVRKGDHIRLQYISLSYEFKKGAGLPLPFQRLQCYMTMNNIGILWRANKDGLDPDYHTATTAVPPPPMSLSLGLRVAF